MCLAYKVSATMESTPICRCRVLYLGSAVPQRSKDGLQGIQEPLRELYPERGAAGGIDSWLSVWSNGILLENVDENGAKVTRFFPISSLHYCAAVRRVAVSGAPARFLPLDSPFARAPASTRPPVFAAVLRRTRGIKVLECHAFACKREMAANALVRCCFHAYADSSYARRLDAGEEPRRLDEDGEEELDAYDGDENHKVWAGTVSLRDSDDDVPVAPPTARTPRPRQAARPPAVPPPPPPDDAVDRRKKDKARTKKRSTASAEEVYGRAASLNGRRGPPIMLMPHPSATLPHVMRPRPPPAAPRMQYATVDPRRAKPPPPPAALKAAQSMSGLDEAGGPAGAGVYRRKGHLNERAFSYSIRQEHRSRSHGSLANLKFAAPPDVDGGREEMKKEREIMQLVAGLELADDGVERREVPPHVLRARHQPPPQLHHSMHR